MVSKNTTKKRTKKNTRKSGIDNVKNRMSKEVYFPTQIYFRDLADAEELNKYLSKKIYAWKRKYPEGIVRSNMQSLGSWHSTVDMADRPEFGILVEIVSDTIRQIYAELGYDPDYPPVCDNMWANISPKYGFNRFHVHPNSLWSGVYYIQTPENCGRVYFVDPRIQAQIYPPRMNSEGLKRSENWKEVYYEPKAGRMIIFPAWLGHEVEPNLSDKKGRYGDRISVAFNFRQ